MPPMDCKVNAFAKLICNISLARIKLLYIRLHPVRKYFIHMEMNQCRRRSARRLMTFRVPPAVTRGPYLAHHCPYNLRSTHCCIKLCETR